MNNEIMTCSLPVSFLASSFTIMIVQASIKEHFVEFIMHIGVKDLKTFYNNYTKWRKQH